MKLHRLLPLVALAALLAPSQALATWWHVPTCDPDSVGSGTVEIVDPTFGAYTVQKTFEVFSDKNCGNPVKVNGSFTYVYTLEVLASSQVGLLEFRVPVPSELAVVEAGFVGGGPDVEPVSTTVITEPEGTFVVWEFPATSLQPGQTSAPLYVVSPFQSGGGTVQLSGQFGLAASGPCIVPTELPEPCPCSAFFWKLRSIDWWWVSHFFPGGDFDDVKARAVELSGGFFASEAALTDALKYWGFLSAEKRAKRQLAAVLLNVAAGELFPANTKCRLFEGTELDLDGDDVGDTTVAEAIAQIIADIESGDYHLQNDAFALALDINLGRNVIGAVSFH